MRTTGAQYYFFPMLLPYILITLFPPIVFCIPPGLICHQKRRKKVVCVPEDGLATIILLIINSSSQIRIEKGGVAIITKQKKFSKQQ